MTEKRRSSTSNRPYDEIFEEITDLLAEALFKDFQEHRRAMVNSPEGLSHKIMLTEAKNEIK